MDDHARRVTRPFVEAWADFQEGRASLLDLSRRATQAASALDNASAPLPGMLSAAASDLEYAYFTTEREDHLREAHPIVDPLMAVMGASP